VDCLRIGIRSGPDTITAGTGNDSIFDSLTDSVIGATGNDTIGHPA